jgi:hypothetical protein
VAIQDWGITSTDLTRVVEDNNLGVERFTSLGRIVLGITTDISTTDFLDGNVLDVEANVVSRKTLDQGFVMHFNTILSIYIQDIVPFDFSGDIGRSKSHNHTSLNDTGFDSADGNCSNPSDLVDVLERKTKGLIGRSNRRLDRVNSLEESEALDSTGFALLLPAFEPGHVG